MTATTKYVQIMKQMMKLVLTDKYVLYFTLFAALSNLFIYMAMKEYLAVIFFLVVGFIASLFSKNMIIILVVAIATTAFAVTLKIINKVREGLEDMTKEKEAEEEGKDVSEAERADVKVSERQKMEKTEEPEGVPAGKPKIDYASTLESAYDNLDKLLSSDAIKNMSADTQRLASKQQQLMGNIEKLEPMMKTAQELMSNLNVDGIAEKIIGFQKGLGYSMAKEEEGKQRV